MPSPTEKIAPLQDRAGGSVPLTLFLGLGLLILLETLLFLDLRLSGRGAIHADHDVLLLTVPVGWLAQAARFVAFNLTPLAWGAFMVFMDGVMELGKNGSPIRRRPHHFLCLALASVFIWCVFDWINFYFINAWTYIGMNAGFGDRFLGYFLAFATIVPGMLLCGQLLLERGWFNWARSPAWRMPRWAKYVALACGCAMFAWPLASRNPISNYTLWTSLVFLLDPINLKLGRPSMFRDWQNGWYGRTLAACAGGLCCGFLWEFWNYWALSKWVYHLPFLGRMENYRYFEMPLPGLLGFLSFGMECWVMWQTMRILLDGLVEPLPNERTLL